MPRHVQNTDSSVLERRLRPIYDWLDTGNNKKALQECEKVLKKTPSLQCAKALKALTLHRMGRESDSVTILDNLCSENPTDDSTLQAMTMCYREMHQLEKNCKIYENALKHDPSNEELHTQLFMSFVRINDFKAQQQSAMALYKLKPKNPYYCWIVMSIVLQATRGEGSKDETKQTVLLSLAERMMKKLVEDNKIDAEQEVQLYMLVLKLLNKHEEIIQCLEGPLGERLQSTNLSQVKLEYYIKVKKWHQVNVLCKSILNESFDKWEVWKQYINSAFELTDVSINGDNTLTDDVDNTPEKCHEFICSVIEGGASNCFLLRGPYLARFELCARLQEKNIDSLEILGDKVELFIEYFRKFGYKPCFVSDLRIYLKLLDSDQKQDLAMRLIKDVGIGPTSVPQTADQMQRHIGALQLSRLCGAHRHLSLEHLKALVTALILHYQHGYQAYGKDLLSTDMGPSDNYAILASHILYDCAKMGAGSQYLVGAIALLETMLKSSPNNFHAKLLLVKFYHMLGDAIGANDVFFSLDIKYLQLDSLGYIHCAQLATCGIFSMSAIHYDTTLKFFSSNYKDNTDHLTYSYKFGSFIKLDEFMDFRERLNNSMHYTTVVVDRIILSLIDCGSIDALYNLDISPKDNKIQWDKLRDNRDVQVYVAWDPEFAGQSVEESEEIRKLFGQDLYFLKLRTHILWVLSAALEVLKSVDGTRQKHIENVKKVLRDWKELEENVRNSDTQPISQEFIGYPPPSRLHGYLETPYRSTIAVLAEFFLSLAADNMEEADVSSKNFERHLEHLMKNLEAKVPTDKPTDFQEKKRHLELFVNNLEVICICGVFCTICSELVKGPQTKKNKKKQGGDSKTKDLMNRVTDRVKNEINKFSELLTNWTEIVTEKDFVSVLESLSLNGENQSDSLYKSFINSYSRASMEIQTILSSKLKMLNV